MDQPGLSRHAVTVGERLDRLGISRREFLQFCSSLAAMMALPAAAAGRPPKEAQVPTAITAAASFTVVLRISALLTPAIME